MRAALAAAALAAGLAGAAPAPAAAEDVLVFTRTEGYRHESIPAGVEMIRSLGAANGFAVTETTDGGAFTADGLAPYEAVVFLSTNREVLDDAQQAALEAYVREGGGWAGIHAAADTEYGWPFYGELLGGAWFASHPPIQPARVLVEDASHPSTSGLPSAFRRSDEWYAFTAPPRARVLLRVDESSYEAGDSAMGFEHPIAWCRDVGRGRSWYTAMGHAPEAYAEPAIRRHVLGGILSAAGRLPADCTPRGRDAPQLIVPVGVGRRELRRRGVPVDLLCSRGCRARLWLVAGEATASPARGRRLSPVWRVAVRRGEAVRLRVRARGRVPARVRVVAAVRPRGGPEETLIRVVSVL